jgi:hypothetical protein
MAHVLRAAKVIALAAGQACHHRFIDNYPKSIAEGKEMKASIFCLPSIGSRAEI